MSGLLEALTSIATAAATQATAKVVQRLALGAVAVLCLLLGIGFAFAAGYDALAIAFDPLTAKLIIAGVFILIGLAILLVMSIQKARQRRKSAEGGQTTAMAVAFAMGLLSGIGHRGK